jgi:hypothetical protein
MTIGDLFENYPFRTAWKMIFESMLKKIRWEMDRPRFRRRRK